MNAAPQKTVVVHPLERWLAVFGAVACVAVTIVIWRNVSSYQGMWPLPALYFIEIAALSMISSTTFVRGGPASRSLMWGAVGVLGAFCILGLFSVGPLYIPIVLIFGAVSIAAEVRNSEHLTVHLAVCLLAALAQAALMLTAIRWLDPGASF